jgi:hypothetical protein
MKNRKQHLSEAAKYLTEASKKLSAAEFATMLKIYHKAAKESDFAVTLPELKKLYVLGDESLEDVIDYPKDAAKYKLVYISELDFETAFEDTKYDTQAYEDAFDDHIQKLTTIEVEDGINSIYAKL